MKSIKAKYWAVLITLMISAVPGIAHAQTTGTSTTAVGVGTSSTTTTGGTTTVGKESLIKDDKQFQEFSEQQAVNEANLKANIAARDAAQVEVRKQEEEIRIMRSNGLDVTSKEAELEKAKANLQEQEKNVKASQESIISKTE